MQRLLFEPDRFAACAIEQDEVFREKHMQEDVLRQTEKYMQLSW